MLRNIVASAFGNLALGRLYAAVTLIGLALALAAAILTALFVRQQYAYEAFIPGHERIFRMTGTVAQPGQPERVSAVTPSVLAAALAARGERIEAVARLYQDDPVVRAGAGQAPARAEGFVWADPAIFRVLPLAPAAGDLVSALAEPGTVVLARSAARRLFGRDAPLGAALDIVSPAGATERLRVTAVIADLPPETHLDLQFIASGRGAGSPLARADASPVPTINLPILTYVRAAPGTRAADLQGPLDDIIRPFQAMAAASGTKVGGYAMPIADIHFGPPDDSPHGKPGVDPAIVVAIGIVGLLILAMASTSYIALMTARAGRRGVEVAVRKACGAGRRQLLAQFLGETLLVTLIALVLAMGVVELVLPAVNGLLGLSLSFDLTREPALLLPLLAVWLAVGLASGFYPAFILSSFRPSAALGGGTAGLAAPVWIGRAMVIVQFATLAALLVAAATIYRQTDFAIGSALGAGRGPVLTVATNCRTGLPQAMRELPGVRSASCSAAGAFNLAPQGAVTAINRDGRRFTPGFVDVDSHFFALTGLKPLAGRVFSPGRDGEAARRELVVNRTAARHFGFASPAAAIGQPLAISLQVGPNPPTTPYTIVGVVPDAAASVIEPAGELIYNVAPPERGTLAIETSPAALANVRRGLDRLWAAMGDGGPAKPRLLAQIEAERYRATIVQGRVIGGSAFVALVIAAMGLFALSAFTVDRRTKEIGIRRAMGASPGAIVRLLLWQFLLPVIAASAIGIGLSYAVMAHWLQQFASRVDVNIWILIAIAAGTAAFATIVMSAQIAAAARGRPVDALRYE
ncbi:putative ABC transport system permease protein [Sphingopyxis panaciterrae]|uniref:FtsX-like permease family protein n=1 Tax=Sphingopyxis panaciterrae TaxID=363841 RepID=UPI00141D83E1|nr:FtsX-like permease family protein [Sphingopyxis panaciterrae]NIJ35451.1 putative ABC transport system permease protein [Sphingopyxis panaciterrae]